MNSSHNVLVLNITGSKSTRKKTCLGHPITNDGVECWKLKLLEPTSRSLTGISYWTVAAFASLQTIFGSGNFWFSADASNVESVQISSIIYQTR